jgi:hypothetical protein
MVRPLSRIGRLCLAFAGGAVGVGGAIVVTNNPALSAIFGAVLLIFVALPNIGRGVGGVARVIERRRLNKRRRS